MQIDQAAPIIAKFAEEQRSPVAQQWLEAAELMTRIGHRHGACLGRRNGPGQHACALGGGKGCRVERE